MAISRLTGQDATNNSGNGNVVATYPGATTAGNLLIATVFSNQALGSNAISGWTSLVDGHAYGGQYDITILYKLADGSETTVTATSAGANHMVISIFEYTGNANPIQTDGTAAAQNTSSTVTSYTTPSITTTNANDLIFSVMSDGQGTSPSWATSTTIGSNTADTFSHIFSGQNIVSSTQSGFSDTGSWTGASTAGSLIGAFQAAGGGTTTSTSSTSSSTSSTSTSSTSSSTSVSSTSSSTSISSTSSSTSYSTSTSVSTSSTSTSTTTIASNNLILTCGSDVVWEGQTARDYKCYFYCYEPAYISIPDTTADVTVYFSVSSKNANSLPTNVKNWGYRTKSVERNYGTISGYMNSFAHFSGSQRQALVCPPGSVITLVSVNIAP